MLGNYLIGAALITVMVIATGVAMDQFERLTIAFKARRLFLASVLLGFAVSLPELFIAVLAGLSGVPEMAIGDLIGANIANLSWVIGGAAIMAGSISITGEYAKEELWITMLLVMAPFLLMMDNSLSRFDGLLLIFGFSLYLNDLIKKGGYRLKQAKLDRHIVSVHHKLFLKRKLAHFMVLFLAMLVLTVSSYFLIRESEIIAQKMKVSTFWIGLVILALGTTLPEIMLSIEALRRKKVSLMLGNLLGSVIANASVIMGLGVIAHPVAFDDNLSKGVAGIFTVVVLGLFWLFTRTKRKLDRWEGLVLVGIYAMFVGVQFLVAR